MLDPVTLPTVDLTLIAGIGLAFPRCAHTSQSDIEDALIRRALRGSTLRIDPALGAAAPEAALSGKKDFRGFGHVALLPCSDALRGLLGDAFTHRLNDALLADPAEIPRSGRLPPWRPKPIPADEYRLTEGPANLNEPLAAAETLAYASHRRAAADAMVP